MFVFVVNYYKWSIVHIFYVYYVGSEKITVYLDYWT